MRRVEAVCSHRTIILDIGAQMTKMSWRLQVLCARNPVVESEIDVALRGIVRVALRRAEAGTSASPSMRRAEHVGIAEHEAGRGRYVGIAEDEAG